jgi:intracellular sulfur oxidation DsrE/DsrF family protein
MNSNDHVSEELLHALIDGELEPGEAEQLYARLGEDEALANRVCVLRGMKDMVRLAYSHPPCTNADWQEPFRGPQGWPKTLAAAAVLLATGLGAGWIMHAKQNVPLSVQAGYDQSAPVRLSAIEADASKILLHIDSASPQKFAALLDRADRLLKNAQLHNANLQVEVLANNRGLDLLRADRTPYASRIATLIKQNENVRFIACAQTLTRLSHEEGHIALLPQTHTAPTAIGEVVNRLQQGWTYIKI